mmetsp:Transcript_33762/g.77075  ORF Transcript_33762/g.77075 Transcript_33762/m.77075 type:complete len:244 (+) Transcript_33762:57-788(+)
MPQLAKVTPSSIEEGTTAVFLEAVRVVSSLYVGATSQEPTDGRNWKLGSTLFTGCGLLSHVPTEGMSIAFGPVEDGFCTAAGPAVAFASVAAFNGCGAAAGCAFSSWNGVGANHVPTDALCAQILSSWGGAGSGAFESTGAGTARGAGESTGRLHSQVPTDGRLLNSFIACFFASRARSWAGGKPHSQVPTDGRLPLSPRSACNFSSLDATGATDGTTAGVACLFPPNLLWTLLKLQDRKCAA